MVRFRHPQLFIVTDSPRSSYWASISKRDASSRYARAEQQKLQSSRYRNSTLTTSTESPRVLLRYRASYLLRHPRETLYPSDRENRFPQQQAGHRAHQCAIKYENRERSQEAAAGQHQTVKRYQVVQRDTACDGFASQRAIHRPQKCEGVNACAKSATDNVTDQDCEEVKSRRAQRLNDRFGSMQFAC